MNNPIRKYSGRVYEIISNPLSIIPIFIIILCWFLVGIKMHFDDAWYRFLEGFIIILTLFMVFVIEHNQHANLKAINAKLDELLKKDSKSDNKKIGIEKKFKGEKT